MGPQRGGEGTEIKRILYYCTEKRENPFSGGINLRSPTIIVYVIANSRDYLRIYKCYLFLHWYAKINKVQKAFQSPCRTNKNDYFFSKNCFNRGSYFRDTITPSRGKQQK